MIGSQIAAGLSCLVLLGGPSTAVVAQEPHFHHVHLNTVDPEKSAEFYRRFFGAVPIHYHGDGAPGVNTERSFILFNKVSTPPPGELSSALWHIGWGGVDGPNEYAYLKSQGIEFQTDVSPLGQNYYMYLYGPDRELIEVYTGEKNHRYNHVHLLATDTNATVQWFRDNLYLEARQPGDVEPRGALGTTFWSNTLVVDAVSIIVFGAPDAEHPPSYYPPEAKVGAFAPTKGRAIDHIAFSFRDIDPVFEHAKANGATIVDGIAQRPELGTRSFFLLAPDDVLVEVVEAKPLPDAIWEP